MMKPALGRARRILATILLAPLLLLAVAWTCGALYYTFPVPALRAVTAIAFAVGSLLAVLLVKRKRRAIGAIALGFAATLAWFLSIPARTDRNWRPELAVMPWAEIEGDRIRVHGVRDFEYRAPDDFDIRYDDRAFDLSKLQAVDVYYSYWDQNEAVAHTMFSWDFGGSDVLCLSVEVRREVGQEAGALPGMFKQFEILYILADERDVVRLRTNYRRERVYLIRSLLTPDEGRRVLLDVLAKVNRFHQEPEFYRTIGNNCTTSMINLLNEVLPNRVPFSKKILMNGYAPEIAYANHLHATDLPFDEWKRRSNINPSALAADRDPLFSRRIREGLPSMPAVEQKAR
jgi:hypothetical protein